MTRLMDLSRRLGEVLRPNAYRLKRCRWVANVALLAAIAAIAGLAYSNRSLPTATTPQAGPSDANRAGYGSPLINEPWPKALPLTPASSAAALSPASGPNGPGTVTTPPPTARLTPTTRPNPSTRSSTSSLAPEVKPATPATAPSVTLGPDPSRPTTNGATTDGTSPTTVSWKTPSATSPPTTLSSTTASPATTSPPPDRPRISGGTFTVQSGKDSKLYVLDLGGGIGEQGDGAALSIVTAPDHADSYRVHGDHVHYKSHEGFVGQDSLQYQVCTVSHCVTATASIAVVD